MKEEAKFHPSGVILDMDGLMLDTERPVISLWIQAAKSLGWDVHAEIIIRTIGIDRVRTTALLTQEYGPDFPLDRIREKLHLLAAQEFEKGITLKPGLAVLLDHLTSRSIPFAVATSTFRDRAIWQLRKAGILERFDVLVCGEDIANGKPAPDIFLLAAEKIGQDPYRCVGFEDSTAGLQGLHAAGIRSVFVKDVVNPPPEVLATVWRRCTDLAEATDLFN